jgi:hypothetical protein
MSLASGTRIGSYTILSSLGAGGMGEVYRARDNRLNRDVALKLLPASEAGDPDRLSRFEREAQVLAALNHPNIAHIHGFEESDGANAIVMELVEGPTLADRLASGPLPLEEALPGADDAAAELTAPSGARFPGARFVRRFGPASGGSRGRCRSLAAGSDILMDAPIGARDGVMTT